MHVRINRSQPFTAVMPKLKLIPALITILCILLFAQDAAFAQRRKKEVHVKEVSVYDIDSLFLPVPRQRKLWHDKIDHEQKRADFSDGEGDGIIYYSDDTTYTATITKAILKDVDHLQVMIENMPAGTRDPVMDNQEKIRCLTAVYNMLYKYNQNVSAEPYFYKKLVTNMHDLIIARNEGRGMDFIKANVNVYTLNNVKELYESASQEKAYIYSEMGKAEPQMMIKRLAEFANEPYADDVVSSAAKVVPGEIFNYASSTNYPLSSAVKRSKDPLVQAIVRIAQESKAPLKALPFVYDIYTNKLTIAQVDQIAANDDLYYQNLVRLKLENVALGGDTYTDELKYRGLKYVRQMNELHEEKDPIRFKCIDNFSPTTLYFIMVYAQDEIYTSTFLGTFKRMMERMTPMKGNELLDTVHRDKFRTFIRMCAGYNTLSQFLATMEPNKKNELMRDFIAGLEKGKEDDLEDAVDVADAFGSITDPELSAYLDRQVKDNYERSYAQAKSKKGIIVYGLLATLFQGMSASDNDTELMAQSERLGLPPISLVQYKNLVNDSGVVYEQFFFYGDEDGKSSYSSFLGNFKDGKWKKTDNKYWTMLTSTTGKPITIFANLPIPEPGDEEAQKELAKYLEANDIHPTVIVHRGHSYHLPLTIDRLTKDSKIVMLGSCGGYHNLGTVLEHSPDAHIISSKQVGTMFVNEPIIKAINDRLLAGNDINWVGIWKELGIYFTGKKADVGDKFSDYIPPHKNLGAIFIKAYRRMLHAD